MTVVGTRPEIIRLSRTINLLDSFCDHRLVHTGQNHDPNLSDIFFSEMGIRQPDHYLGAARDTAGETIGQILTSVDRLLAESRPDAFLVLGDTNSCLAAIVAKRRQIPVFHMEAGNRCFDIRVPEETNRRIIDHTADIHLPYTQIARGYLISEGIAPDQIVVTGSPMREVLLHYKSSIASSIILSRLGLSAGQYFLVSAHREETVDSPGRLASIVSIINQLAASHEVPVIVSTHPRTRRRLNQLDIPENPLVRYSDPFGFFDYCKLQENARAVLSDSGTITEESSILNFPAANLREAHERPEGFEEGSVMLVGLSWERITDALTVLTQQPRGEARALRLVRDYEATNVSEKVLRIILSYTDFVARKYRAENLSGPGSVERQ